MNYLSLSKEQLQAKRDALRSVYDGYCERGLSLNMARGKPSPSQLDLSNAFLQAPASYRSKDGVDARNYSVPDDLPETAQLFASLLGIPTEYIIIGGNSSLNLMYDTLCRMLLFGTLGERPWIEEKNRKFLCPAPGYDRHFSVTQELGFELILVPMTQDGPDMDLVEALVAKDPAIKGIWCVPLYSNPQGVCYSDETVRRLAAMPTAAPDFRIMWDNAYGVHHLYEPVPLMDIFSACEQAGTLDRVFYFFSTSKISFPGGGVSMMAMSPQNRAEALRHISIQTIGPDKVNQLRLLSVLPTAQAVREHMERQAQVLRPRFELVLSALERALERREHELKARTQHLCLTLHVLAHGLRGGQHREQAKLVDLVRPDGLNRDVAQGFGAVLGTHGHHRHAAAGEGDFGGGEKIKHAVKRPRLFTG